jgi:hypothetical protein
MVSWSCCFWTYGEDFHGGKSWHRKPVHLMAKMKERESRSQGASTSFKGTPHVTRRLPIKPYLLKAPPPSNSTMGMKLSL